MRKRLPLLPVLFFLLAAVSCKKSNSGASGSVAGTWNLINIVASTRGAVDEVYGSDDYLDVTYSEYTTTNNSGTIAFSGGVATTSNITYEASFTALDSSYLDGQFAGVVTYPLDVTVPATSGTTKYQQIGSDSLYFPAGGAFTMGTTGGTQTTPQGSRFTIHGDTLVITTSIHQVVNQNVGGVPATQTTDAVETAYLKKQ
ncbi:MAG TPA: hypothetical protein VMH27_05720 [Puia sp.]|nr:hypothetical protein [Puia sp.]